MRAIHSSVYKALISASSAAVFGGAIIASIVGMAYALGWPLSEPNVKFAMILGVLFGLPGCGVTTYVARLVPLKLAVLPLGVGGAVTILVSGAAAFLISAWSAAC